MSHSGGGEGPKGGGAVGPAHRHLLGTWDVPGTIFCSVHMLGLPPPVTAGGGVLSPLSSEAQRGEVTCLGC